MVKLPSVKDSTRQMQGLNSENDTFTQSMVRRFERTGQRATFREQRLAGGKNPTANLTGKPRDKQKDKIVNRIKNGGGGFTTQELKEQFEKPTRVEARPIYPCAVCGTETPWHCKVGTGAAPRCGPCRREARLRTKRETWHKHKEEYQAKAHTVRSAKRKAARAERDAQRQAELDAVMKNTMPRQAAPPRAPKMPAIPKPTPPPPPVAPPPPTTSAAKGPVVVWTP